MKQNEAWVDRIIRMVVGAILVVMAFMGAASGFMMYVAYLVGFIFILTGAVGFCPIYSAFGFSTKKEE